MALNLAELLSTEICGSVGFVCGNYCLVGSDALNFGLILNCNFRLLISTLFVAQQSKSDLSHLFVKVSRSYIIKHTHPVGLL